MYIRTSFSSDWIGLARPSSIVGPNCITFLCSSNPVLLINAYKTLAMGRLCNDPKDGANPVALTGIP